ncbi:MAG: 16S rRNA (guanine(527)-N(7))-methyltransferase RsmG [Saprospiraceae bacterium]
MDLVKKYFPELPAATLEKLEGLEPLYREWNDKINVISRKDIDNFQEHHLLHSLAITKYIRFQPGTEVMDLGTGGGFPGIPLAIVFPEVKFYLIDGIMKKIRVVNEVAEALGLKNVEAHQKRAEELKGKTFDFVVSRAVAPIDKLYEWSYRLIHENHRNSMPNGLIALKGGNLAPELKALKRGIYKEKTHIHSWFDREFFEEKYVVYVQK